MQNMQMKPTGFYIIRRVITFLKSYILRRNFTVIALKEAMFSYIEMEFIEELN